MYPNLPDTVFMYVYILVFILDRSKWISTILTQQIIYHIYIVTTAARSSAGAFLAPGANIVNVIVNNVTV